VHQVSKNKIPLLKDDDDLFELFTGKKSEEFSKKIVSEPETFQQEPQENFAELFEQSLSEIDNFHTIVKEKEASLSARKPLTIKDMLKKYPSPEVDIDLHGYTAKEAQKKVETFIINARYCAIKTVRVIVGKGIHSQGKAVLPDVIEKKIVELKQRNVVLTFQWEKQRKLKSGAMIVYVRPSITQ